MNNQNAVVIVSSARTPIASFNGVFAQHSATQLGAIAINAAVERSKINAPNIDAVIMGNVLSAGLGQAPARQAALNAGLLTSCNSTTINKMCGSGMQAIMLAHDLIVARTNQVMVAGGMESMTNAPHLLQKSRFGIRMGSTLLLDHLMHDGLTDAYEDHLMGVYAERCASHYKFSRKQQDDFAKTSLTRAINASAEGAFINEIATVKASDKYTTKLIDTDEGPKLVDFNNISSLKPVFKEHGTVTAANSSSISDGAAALVLMDKSKAISLGMSYQATIMAHSSFAHESSWFTTAPISAINKLLDTLNWNIADVDLFEINEAFAVVAMAAIKELKLPIEKVNIHGGACALGHPIGASGARIIVTLINALKTKKLKRGMAAICIGGGEATAIAIEIAD